MIEILIVDDDLFVLESLKSLLENNSINVTTALDAEEALDLCEERDFDIIVLDINLPYKNGIDFANALRERNIQTPIVPISSDVKNRDAEEKLAFGTYFSSDLFLKPLNQNDASKVLSLKSII